MRLKDVPRESIGKNPGIGPIASVYEQTLLDDSMSVRVRVSERAKARSWSEVGFRDRANKEQRRVQVGSPRILGNETRVICMENRIGVVIERRAIRKRARHESKGSVPK